MPRENQRPVTIQEGQQAQIPAQNDMGEQREPIFVQAVYSQKSNNGRSESHEPSTATQSQQGQPLYFPPQHTQKQRYETTSRQDDTIILKTVPRIQQPERQFHQSKTKQAVGVLTGRPDFIC